MEGRPGDLHREAPGNPGRLENTPGGCRLQEAQGGPGTPLKASEPPGKPQDPPGSFHSCP
eukprot:696886-Pyramimonas_sp.AAC.1